MRWIGLSLVLATLVFGAGGVATRPLADTAESAESAENAEASAVPDMAAPDSATDPSASAAAPAADALARVVTHATKAPIQRGTCGDPMPPVRSVKINLSKIKIPADFVSLNRSGYNYRQPGDPPQIIPDSTGTKKPAFMK